MSDVVSVLLRSGQNLPGPGGRGVGTSTLVPFRSPVTQQGRWGATTECVGKGICWEPVRGMHGAQGWRLTGLH